MNPITAKTVRAYYDQRIDGKLRDFTDANPRVEAAIESLAEWAPFNPRRILEIGCGIGATAWRMARAWPRAEIVAVDVSPASVEVARTCFRRPNLTYRAGVLQEAKIEGTFDLVVLMDVYEHIAPADRASLHATIRSLLSEESRLFVSVPTPEILDRARRDDPSGLQPIDEDIRIGEIDRLARDTASELLYYRRIGIWNYGDYAHVVCGRFEMLAIVASREAKRRGIHRLAHGLRQLRGVGGVEPTQRRDYLGFDLPRRRGGEIAARLRVSTAERRRLAARWAGRTRAKAGS